MLIYCVYTPAHERLLREHFIPTLPASFELRERELLIEGAGDFLSREFLECIGRKLDLIVESIRGNDGRLIVWSDIDIVFFRDVVAELEQLAVGDPEGDFWWQQEGPATDEVNAGFILIRCSERTAAFFEEAKTRMLASEGKNEQAVENEMFAEGWPVQLRRLPLSFAARTHGWPPLSDPALYHANMSGGRDGVGQKIRQFRDVATIRRLGAFGPAFALWSGIRNRLKAAFGG